MSERQRLNDVPVIIERKEKCREEKDRRGKTEPVLVRREQLEEVQRRCAAARQGEGPASPD